MAFERSKRKKQPDKILPEQLGLSYIATLKFVDQYPLLGVTPQAIFNKTISTIEAIITEYDEEQYAAKQKLIHALKALRNATQKYIKSNIITLKEGYLIADAAHELLRFGKVDEFKREVFKVICTPVWQKLVMAFIGAFIGFCVGLTLGAATGPVAAFTALTGGAKGAIIGASLGAASGSIFGWGAHGFFKRPRGLEALKVIVDSVVDEANNINFPKM
jgi:hypothetical protein